MVRDPSSYRSARRTRNPARPGIQPLNPIARPYISRANVFIGSAAVALVVTLIIAALSFAGLIGMTLARACLLLAWLVSLVALLSSRFVAATQSQTRRAILTVMIVVVITLIFLAVDRVIDAYRPFNPYSDIIAVGNEPYTDLRQLEIRTYCFDTTIFAEKTSWHYITIS